MSIPGKLFKWTCVSLLGLFSLAIVFSILAVALGVTLNLDKIRPAVETAISGALDRNIRITGPVTLQPTLRPALEVHGIQIDNPEGWSDAVFASIGRARLQLSIPALINRQIDIDDITCEGITLNLETNRQGISNWQFTPSPADTPKPEQKSSTPPEESRLSLQALDKLSLQKINIHYRDSSLEQEISFQLDQLNGEAGQGEPLQLTGEGRIQDKHYNFTLEGGALEDFHPRRQPYPLSVSGNIAGSPFSAKGSFGRDNDEPMIDLDATLAKVDTGALLDWLGIAKGIDAGTEELALQLRLRGNSLHELVTQSNLIFTVKEGRWTLHGAGSGDGLPIAISQGKLSAISGKPVALTLDGLLDTTPVNIKIKGMKLINYILQPKKLPITIGVEVADTTIDFQGEVNLPIKSSDLSLAMTIKGKRLDSLDELLELDLPPMGPYLIEAGFSMGGQSYNLSNLRLHIGSSDLTGRMRLDMAELPPVAEVQLESDILQINDFVFDDWSLERGRVIDEHQGDAPKNSESILKEDRHYQKTASLLSPEALTRANAGIRINLDKVLSGKDVVGSGKLEASVQDGRFRLDPLELKLADGTARIEFSYFPTRETAEVHLAAAIDNLDVGILTRRMKPETNMAGQLHLDLLLDAVAPDLAQIMANGRGHIDFAFVPENFDAGIIDLWAVNLLASVASEVDAEPKSVINCLVASFGMEDGLMQDRVIFMDTTQMSVEGQASLDFRNRKLEIVAAPKAKKPQFFSLATPVKFNGTFDDFGLRFNMIQITGTVASFVTSPIHVPIRRLFAGNKPADGKEACRMAWENRYAEK